MKIWAKLITDGKIKQQFVYENPERLTYSHFFDYLTDICHELDIPTPVLLKTHIFNFAKFNHVKFVQRDFVESLEMSSSNGAKIEETQNNKPRDLPGTKNRSLPTKERSLFDEKVVF